MEIHKSAEDYLESILVLKERLGIVRSIDIVRELEYSKPSVSRGVGILKQQNYIVVDKDGYITLTEEGEREAKKIFDRHILLTKLLVSMGVDEETATDDACRIEHVISDTTFSAIKKFVESL